MENVYSNNKLDMLENFILDEIICLLSLSFNIIDVKML